MKKLLSTGLLVCCLSLFNSAQAVTLQQIKGNSGSCCGNKASVQQYVNEIGFKILNANKIDKHIIFGSTGFVAGNSSSAVNPMAMMTGFIPVSMIKVKDDVTDSKRGLFNNRKVLITGDLIENACSDDEVAALVSHEIAHCLESYKGILRGSFHSLVYKFTAKKQNYKADEKAVDLMVKAGYNPTALITILNKTAGQYRFDIGENALTTKRMRKIHEYIKANYPKSLSAYASNIYYVNAMNVIAPEEGDYSGFIKSKKNK